MDGQAGRQGRWPYGVAGVWILFQLPLEERRVTLDSLQLIPLNMFVCLSAWLLEK